MTNTGEPFVQAWFWVFVDRKGTRRVNCVLSGPMKYDEFGTEYCYQHRMATRSRWNDIFRDINALVPVQTLKMSVETTVRHE